MCLFDNAWGITRENARAINEWENPLGTVWEDARGNARESARAINK